MGAKPVTFIIFGLFVVNISCASTPKVPQILPFTQTFNQYGPYVQQEGARLVKLKKLASFLEPDTEIEETGLRFSLTGKFKCPSILKGTRNFLGFTKCQRSPSWRLRWRDVAVSSWSSNKEQSLVVPWKDLGADNSWVVEVKTKSGVETIQVDPLVNHKEIERLIRESQSLGGCFLEEDCSPASSVSTETKELERWQKRLREREEGLAAKREAEWERLAPEREAERKRLATERERLAAERERLAAFAPLQGKYYNLKWNMSLAITGSQCGIHRVAPYDLMIGELVPLDLPDDHGFACQGDDFKFELSSRPTKTGVLFIEVLVGNQARGWSVKTIIALKKCGLDLGDHEIAPVTNHGFCP